MGVIVTRNQCVVGVQRVIKPRAEVDEAGGLEHPQTNLLRIEVRVKNRSLDEVIVVDLAPLNIHKERSLLLNQRPAEIPAILAQLKRRTIRGERVARIQALVVKVQERAAAKLVCARPGKHVDPSRGLIILCREGILVDANFADRTLRR